MTAMNKILVTRSSMPELDEYINEIKEMWDTHWLTNMGPKHRQLQEGSETSWAWRMWSFLQTVIWRSN